MFVATAVLFGQQPDPTPQEIVQKSLEQDRINFRRARDYTFVQEVVSREFDGQGRLKETKSETFDVVMIGGRPYRRQIAKDGKPLSGRAKEEAEREFEEEIRKRQTESEGQRRKQQAQEEKRRRETRELLDEVPRAYLFRLVGEGQVEGLPVWILEAEPRTGFKPRSRRAGFLSKMRGRIWIDKGEYQWVRAEVETIDTVSFGWILARLGKGTRMTFEQSRVNDEIWLPRHATTKLNARVALVKKFNAEFDVKWRDYRKFQTDSRILDVSETELPSDKPASTRK